jgi:hypothetical protein
MDGDEGVQPAAGAGGVDSAVRRPVAVAIAMATLRIRAAVLGRIRRGSAIPEQN